MPVQKIWLFSSALALLGSGTSLAYARNTMPKNLFDKLSSVPLPDSEHRLLVLVPHPDDESLALGGYLYMCRQAGAAVRLILVSDGNRRGLHDRRSREFSAATRNLGIADDDLRLWGYPDGRLSEHRQEITAKLAQEIRDYRPEMLIYSHPHDRHYDHAILGMIAEQVLAAEPRPEIKPYAYLTHFKYYPRPVLLARHRYLLPPRANGDNNERWEKVNLSPDAQRAKLAALKQHRSQLRNPFLLPLFISLYRENELLEDRQAHL